MTEPTDTRRTRLPLPSAVAPLLVLAPLIAAGDTILRGLWLGAGVFIVLAMTGAVSRMTATRLPDEIRLGVVAVLTAATVTVLDLFMAAFLPAARAALAADLPLVAASSLVLAGGVTLVRDVRARRSMTSELATIGLSVALFVALAAAREWFGHLAQLARQPSGAFLLLGVGLAAFNGLRMRQGSVTDARAMDREGRT